MLTDEEEVIARFIALFDVLDEDLRGRVQLPEGGAALSSVDLTEPEPGGSPAARGGIGTPSFDPHIRYANDAFHLEKVRSVSLELDRIAVTPKGAPLELSLGSPNAPPAAGLLPPDMQTMATIGYSEATTGSLLARFTQVNVTDDRDVLDMSADRDPLETIEAVTRQFEAMLDLARDAAALPAPLVTPADFATQLVTRAADLPFAAGRGAEAPTGHEGIFVDGAPALAAPDVSAFFAEPEDPQETEVERIEGSPLDLAGPHAASLDTGGNQLLAEASLLNIGHLAPVSILMGNWHETNSIRQVNIHDDRRDVTGTGEAPLATHGLTEAYNVAAFERIDATPGPPPSSAGLPFPGHYAVDVWEGDLFVSTTLRQVNMMLDGDRVALSSIRHDAVLETGGNESVDAFDLLVDSPAYDLVVFGGHVFEGNFIEQINVLLDSDRLHSDRPGPPPAEEAVSSGANMLVNDASITNYGAIHDFTDITPELRELVARFAAGDTVSDGALGADLAFLGMAQVEVLYVTGSLFEASVFSQTNILNDSDSVSLAVETVREVVASAGPDAAWTISTGANSAVNAARITDVDDVSEFRFIQGEYYSDSMLLQAEIVAADDDIATFDVRSLVPELVAFTTDDDPDVPDHGHGAPSGSGFHDMHADGLAGVLS